MTRCRPADPARAAGLLLGVWLLLALGRPLRGWLRDDRALLASFGAASVLVLWERRSRVLARTRRASAARDLALGWLLGYAALPLARQGIAILGLALGLAPPTNPGTARPDVALVVACSLLAPLFEELLYRDRLLEAARARLGAAAAVPLVSALFALPHLAPWSGLGSFVVGLGLGALRLQLGCASGCVAVHSGLNAAVLVGAPWPGTPLRAGLAAVWLALLLAALRIGARPGGGFR